MACHAIVRRSQGCGGSKIQINTTNGDTMDGMSACPGAPLGYVAEGKTLTKQYDPATFPLTAAVKDKGISEADWEASA